MPIEEKKSITCKCLKVSQPLGDFYIASIPARELVQITEFDVRRMISDERAVESYLGIQRPLNPRRVKEIEVYVRGLDACFPTAVIIAIPGKCIDLNDEETSLTISNYLDVSDEEEPVLYRNIARVLDGQHRLAGLESYDGDFDINVSIFVDADIADQANIFSTVNLAQTKVNRSLAYDLYDLMHSRSPQKTCHQIAVTLDREEKSPFHHKIKRLGVATLGRSGETLTQASFIEPLLGFISKDATIDRQIYLGGGTPNKVNGRELLKHPFQHMFIEEKDFEITDIIWNYFSAVHKRWSEAWENTERGSKLILNRTNGYQALMRFLRAVYVHQGNWQRVPSMEEFLGVFAQIKLESADFNSDRYLPGSGGQSSLYKELLELSGIPDPNRKPK